MLRQWELHLQRKGWWSVTRAANIVRMRPPTQAKACWLPMTLFLVGLWACETPAPQSAPTGTGPLPVEASAIPGGDISVTRGRTVYVPVYSHIYVGTEEGRYAIATTLAVRNTDPDAVIRLTDVSYFDSAGDLLKQFISGVVTVDPRATAEFFVAADELPGGAGANFLVTWEADDDVYEPIVEAIMTGSSGTRAISFSSLGRMYRNP